MNCKGMNFKRKMFNAVKEDIQRNNPSNEIIWIELYGKIRKYILGYQKKNSSMGFLS